MTAPPTPAGMPSPMSAQATAPRSPTSRRPPLGPPVAERATMRLDARVSPPDQPPAWHLSPRWRTGLMLCTWLALVLLWRSPVAVPIKVLTVFFHELGHACAAWVTGGVVHAVAVGADGAGLTLTQGGNPAVILNGGYLGSLLGGMLLLRLLKFHGGGQLAAALLGCTLVLISLVFFAQSPLGYGIVLVVAVLMLGLAARSPEGVADWVVRLVGWLCTFYAVIDLFDDVFLNTPDVRTDAEALAALTQVPAPLWGASWVAIGAAFTWTNRRWLV